MTTMTKKEEMAIKAILSLAQLGNNSPYVILSLVDDNTKITITKWEGRRLDIDDILMNIDTVRGTVKTEFPLLIEAGNRVCTGIDNVWIYKEEGRIFIR